jgi:phage-related protein
MSTADPAAAAEFNYAENKQFDSQVMYLGGFALVALIVCIILLFVFSTGLAGFGPAFQTAVTVITNRIQGTLPGATQLFSQKVILLKSLASNTLDKASDAIVLGSSTVLNVVVSVGQSVLDHILTGLQGILNLLEEMGADLLQFFANVFSPIDVVAQILGQVVEDAIQLIADSLTPLFTLILQLVLLGHAF